ncbi:TetR/AcrR family transcriptional regulator [Actinomadura livida]|uniref:TetR/AcrR family transcriptional regulator n=1 Tax=Actinomadura livida TaxID=79909 RepID=A0ABN1E5Y1_9ACTN|nr:TetR family transcriptional regulator [Actinomadura livida]
MAGFARARLRRVFVAGSESWREYGPSPLPKVLQGALRVFAEHGYEGASIRDLATAAGLSVPGMYHHYRSKQEILVSLLESALTDLIGRCRSALASAGGEPIARFDALVECLVRFHMFRRAEAFVASTELRSLEPGNRDRCVTLRDELQRMVADVIEAGCAAGVFSTPYPADAARAVSTLCVGVATWYREDGPLAPDQVVERQLVLLRSLVGLR